jgi:regulatory protein
MFSTNKPKIKAESFSSDENGGEECALVITRTSDTKKKYEKKTTFGKKVKAAVPGEITRTSDKPSRFKKIDPTAPRKKPNHSSQSYAVWLLSKREYTASALRKKLVLRGYSDDEADTAMTYVQSKNYQSDERYAALKSRGIERRTGNARVVMTLKSKGIDEDMARAQIVDLDPEENRALLLVEKFAKYLEDGRLPQAVAQKAYRFLASRGFSSSSVNYALKNLQCRATEFPDIDNEFA